ncbi:MAG: FG-GAP repeat protein, partial [Planctomycetes bacterium]|nr:FG-GAP repeat protein [Planctomycetota bacterium]
MKEARHESRHEHEPDEHEPVAGEPPGALGPPGAGASAHAGPRWALRERLSAYLRAAGPGRLLRLLREAAFAAAVAAALLGAASPAGAIEAIELADVAAGQGGFAVEGKGRLPSDVGASVANAGDVNGDGIPDAIVGGRYCGYVCYTVPSYVVLGRADGAPMDLEDVAAGRGGFVIRGESKRDRSGSSVSGAGDVNGDGLSDLLIGAPRADPGGRDRAGASYVVVGKTTTEAVELSAVAGGQGGFVMRGSGGE